MGCTMCYLVGIALCAGVVGALSAGYAGQPGCVIRSSPLAYSLLLLLRLLLLLAVLLVLLILRLQSSLGLLASGDII